MSLKPVTLERGHLGDPLVQVHAMESRHIGEKDWRTDH